MRLDDAILYYEPKGRQQGRQRILDSHFIDAKIDRAWFAEIYKAHIIRSRSYEPVPVAHTPSAKKKWKPIVYRPTDETYEEASIIANWLLYLPQMNPLLYADVRSMSYSDALHEAWTMKEQGRPSSTTYIDPDASGSPLIMEVEDGWKVYWLTGQEDRFREGVALGHQIGCDGEDLEDDLVISIREAEHAEITVRFNERGVVESHHSRDVSEEDARRLIDMALSRAIPWLVQGDFPQEDPEVGHDCYQRRDGTVVHTRNCILHREDGPALSFPDGETSWWLDGREMTEREHRAAVSSTGSTPSPT